MQHPRLALALVLLAAPAAAQADWRTDLLVPKPRAVHAAAFDQARGQVVLFGGNTNSGGQSDTWLWSPAGGWTMANPNNVPAARLEHGMAYDAVRREVVLFGGRNRNGQLLDDTWVWDGRDWTLRSPATRPSPRTAEMAWDPSGAQVLMFGGDNGGRLADTWGWNGTTWVDLRPAAAPAARADHGVATDWARGEVVLFGGWNSGFFSDTWTFKSGVWTQHQVAGPSARSEHRMAYNGIDVVLFSGDTGAGRPADTWHWNGTAWSQKTLTPSPQGLEEHELVYVQTLPGALLFGGWAPGIGHVADPWRYSITGQWTRDGADAPPGTGTHAMAIDPATGQALMFGGYQDTQHNGTTWSYQSGVWLKLSPASSPPARVESAMAYDEVRKEFVLFSGVSGSNNYSDTWVFRGGNWIQRTPAASPPARWGHVMTFDAGRGTVLLFSGRGAGTATNLIDTWEWNGTTWTQLSPAATPAGREDSSLVYDGKRKETILFGGWVIGAGFSDETWAFRGGNWVRLSPTNSPTPRSEHVMAYDSWRDRIVMFSGEDRSGRVNDTWEWDGTNWAQRIPANAPEKREEAAMVFDPIAGECVMFAGWDIGHFTDTWHYASRPAATVVPYGTGCRGSAAAAPTLDLDRLWLGDTVTFRVQAAAPMPTALLLIGFTKANTPLAALGMPGCTLLMNQLLTLPLPTAGSSASLPVTMPTTASLIGAKILAQGAAGQPGANGLGLLSTAALEATAGMR